MRISTVALIGSMSIFAACGVQEEPREVGTTTMNSHVMPTFVPGNPSCADIHEDLFELKVEPVAAGTYSVGPLTVTIDIADDGTLTWWSGEIGISYVVVKGGPGANVYDYEDVGEATTDDGLHPPINSANDMPYGFSHVSFCYDKELEVSKTAEASFKRTCEWTIDKRLVNENDAHLTLSEGQSREVEYEVHVWRTCVDSDWEVSGTITIENKWDVNADVQSVTDIISPDGIAADVDCGALGDSFTVPPDSSVECSYSAALPDGSNRTNTVTVKTTAGSAVQGASASAAVNFGDPTMVTDDCVTVFDEPYGQLFQDFEDGEVCDEHAVDTYTLTVGPFYGPDDCGGHMFTNTATATTNTTGTQVSDSVTVEIDVMCEDEGGCTLTQGYWKTHSEFGPAPFDDTWDLLPMGASTPFFWSGQTWYEVFHTPSEGNAYYILAVQYMAAVLNGLNGADTSVIAAELAAAKLLLETYTPEQIAMLSEGDPLRQQFIYLAQILDNYNNGLIGPGHCSE